MKWPRDTDGKKRIKYRKEENVVMNFEHQGIPTNDHDRKEITAMNFDFEGVNVNSYNRVAGETDDAGRIQRAVDDNPNGVVVFPEGVYEIGKTINIKNRCSLKLAKNAKLLCVAEMEYILDWDGGKEMFFHDYGMFITGGTIDGAALSGGIKLQNIHHLTMRDIWFKDCKTGLRVGNKDDLRNYELVANNLYFRNEVGIADSVGVDLYSHGDHYFDSIVVVDYQTGFHINSYATFMSKCHSWVSNIVPDLDKTIGYDLDESALWVTLSDCYVDTAKIGVRIKGKCCRMSNVFGYQNTIYGGREHTFLSYESDSPFSLQGGTFVGRKGYDDSFFKGNYTGKVYMQDVYCDSLKDTEILELCKK